MNTKYEKELNRICLHIHVPEIYEEDYQMPMLRANKIPGILEVNGCGIDGESRYTYEITGLVSMAVLFENKQVQKGDIEQFIYCLLESISQLQKYMLHPGCLLLEPEYVFCRKQKYFFCYLPGGKQELCESFHRMTEYFVEKLDYEDEKGITLAYELHKATLEENYDLDAIMQEYRTECEEAEEEEEPDTEEAWEEEEISDSLFTLDTEEEYKPAKDTEVIRESGGVWSAWKKAAHKISRGRLGRWGSSLHKCIKSCRCGRHTYYNRHWSHSIFRTSLKKFLHDCCCSSSVTSLHSSVCFINNDIQTITLISGCIC